MVYCLLSPGWFFFSKKTSVPNRKNDCQGFYGRRVDDDFRRRSSIFASKNFCFFFRFFFVFAVIEEVFKFLAVYLVVRKSRFFDEPVDAMIYMITAALGFAMVENIAVALNASNIQEAIGAMTLRFVGATLLHVLTSGIVGYYWAKSLVLKNQFLVIGRWPLIIKGLILASLLHMIFNYLILVSKEQILIYPTIFLIIIALFLFWDFEKIKNG